SRLADASSPSTVVTVRPSMRATGVTHATRGSPSTSTVQQPHWPCGAQPSFADMTPSRSRNTFKSDSPRSRSASTTTGVPLSTNLISVGIVATVLAAPAAPARETTPPERGRRVEEKRSGERLAAAARPLRVGGVDGETRALAAVLVVERGTFEVLRARGIDDDLHVTVGLDDVVGSLLGVEEHLVRQAGKAARSHRHPPVQLDH